MNGKCDACLLKHARWILFDLLIEDKCLQKRDTQSIHCCAIKDKFH